MAGASSPSTFIRKGDAEGWLNDEEVLTDRSEWTPPAPATIRELMRRLGHTKPDVAMIYQVADDERDREVAARMGMQALAARPTERPLGLREPRRPDWRSWGLEFTPGDRARFGS